MGEQLSQTTEGINRCPQERKEPLSMQEIGGLIQDYLRENSFLPARLIQQGGVVDFIKPRTESAGLNECPYTGEDCRLEQMLEIANRPFCIILAIHPEMKEVIVKVRTKEDPRKSADNEIIFLESVSPALDSIMLGQNEELASRIKIPKFLGSKREEMPIFCVEEYLEGQVAGGIHRADPEVLDYRDIEVLINFMRFFQDQLDYEKVKQTAPEANFPVVDVCKNYLGDFSRRREKLESCLGRELVDAMEAILRKNEDLIRGGRAVFSSRDINSANIIKTKSDQLVLIDWERTGFVNNSAFEYGFLFADLFSNPELQAKFLEAAKKVNKDDPDFLEKFRSDFLFNRGSGELCYWLTASENASSQEEQKICHDAITKFSELLKAAITKSDIWAEEPLTENERASDSII